MKTVFDKISGRVTEAYPDSYVRIEDVPDSPRTRAIAVYGVVRAKVAEVKRFIKDLDWKLCCPKGYVALARVVDFDTTEKFYPDILAMAMPACVLAPAYSLAISPVEPRKEWAVPLIPTPINEDDLLQLAA